MFRQFATILALLLGTCAQAGTLVEIRERGDNTAWIEISGRHIRMSGINEAYLLADTYSERFLAVFPSARQALDITGPTRSGNHESSRFRPPPEFVEWGRGESIAGYATRRYAVTVDNRFCAEVWLSRDALKASGMTRFLHALRLFHRQQQTVLNAEIRGTTDPCDEARQATLADYGRLGLPLRMRDADGNMLREIVSIVTNVPFDEERFRVPDGYEQIAVSELR